ncbi:DUF1634 domain-containing protein [Periweissella ghanensis]|uniref:DUF1634 domain-containing protein n=1 Tax=Periweissella ghanensis TaxID=467997 RepID=A0ABM8Z8V0_9LACO|nr:DUF1634 domain-containing protein [Periweissella ghanensis]MCM0600938.1 DUF1634 domain-containing protein [Periweissella ghanensis]CAH0417644.1 hypothetical protein WGH24286_00056 [Periweissella ghanensis]
MPHENDTLKAELNQIERTIGKVLRVGVGLAGLVMLIGLVLLIITGKSGYPADTWPTSFSSILTGMTQLKPVAIMMFGLFLLILTPALRVIVSIFAFIKEADYIYVAITVLVLLILIFAIFVGHS